MQMILESKDSQKKILLKIKHYIRPRTLKSVKRNFFRQSGPEEMHACMRTYIIHTYAHAYMHT